MLIIIQQKIRYSMPENSGIPANPCAIPMVNGLRMAPAKPKAAATNTMQTPVMESYPMEMAMGTSIMVKAMVSSLMPNTAPNTLKRSMMEVIIKLSTPILRNIRLFSSRRAFRKKPTVPISNALLSLTIQKAPPIIRINMMISALSTKPSKNADKTCQVCGILSTC